MGYDVFLSYHSQKPVGFWVRQFFVEELKSWLKEQHLGRDARVFYDVDSIRTGEVINDRLKQALGTSTVFVPVLSPSYFNQSEYCVWEWTCYRRWRPDAIMPVLYYRRDALPEDVRGLSMKDFSDVRSAFAAFKDTPAYGPFQDRVSQFAEQLADLIAQKQPPPGGKPPDFQLPELPRPRGVPAIGQHRMVG